jgi:DNA adenine methylase
VQAVTIDAPFPWFGGKRKVSAEVWSRFGSVANYVEPFFGSGAVLLGRPEPFDGNETINDLDGFVANFWRSMKEDHQQVAEWADNPVNENDLHARHIWLVHQRERLRASLEGDPHFFDAKIAGWWVWGISSWIGSGWCSGRGPWRLDGGALVQSGTGTEGQGVERKRPNLPMGGGRGVSRQLPHLGNGQGVTRKLPHLGDNGRGVDNWFAALSSRMSRVRVCSGDWTRVCGPSGTFKRGLTGVFLDPPYADTASRDSELYREDSEDVAHRVREWAIENGSNPMLRIALCGYEGEHEMPPSWAVHRWSAGSGYGGQAEERSENGRRERIWFSPACLSARQESLFA